MVALYSGQSGQNGHFPGRAKIFFQIAPVPTVILARYLPSFCFAILLPLSSFCFIIGARDPHFSLLFLRSARRQPCGILMAA